MADTYRDQIAKALNAYWHSRGLSPSWNEAGNAHRSVAYQDADAVLAVRDEELAQARAERGLARQEARLAKQSAELWEGRVEQLRARLANTVTLPDNWRDRLDAVECAGHGGVELIESWQAHAPCGRPWADHHIGPNPPATLGSDCTACQQAMAGPEEPQ